MRSKPYFSLRGQKPWNQEYYQRTLRHKNIEKAE